MIRASSFAALPALALALAGCEEAPVPPAPVEAGAPAPALWEVTGGGGQKAWLFGTIHALPDGARWHSAALDEALGQADVLVVEIANLGDGDDAAEAFGKLAFTPGLGPFRARQDAQFNRQLDQLLGNDSPGFASDIEDWAAALQIASAASDDASENGVDRALMDAGKPVVGLESYAAQFGIFDALSPADQQALLDAVVTEEGEDDEAAMRTAWLTGDTGKLEELATSGMLAAPGLRHALLEQRNKMWAARIVPMIVQGKEPFVAVGAAHMLGEDGLPALLAARGMQVRRIQ